MKQLTRGRRVYKTLIRSTTRIRREKMSLWMLEQIHNSVYRLPEEARRGEREQTVRKI